MSELEDASVRVYLGAFDPRDDALCSVPLCRCRADRAHAWLIDGDLCVLGLCDRCVDRAIAALGSRPMHARLVTFEEPRDRMATELAKINAGEVGRPLTARPGTAYPRAALARRCSRCGADSSNPCRNLNGSARGEPHVERRDKYQSNVSNL